MKRIWLILLCAVILAASCRREEQPVQPSSEVAIPGVPEGEIPVRIGYSYSGAPVPSTKASVVGGEESGNWVKDLWMLCFTKEGIYLGYRKASFYDDNGVFTNEKEFTDGCHGRELFTGTVPNRTARIHFIANTEVNTPSGQVNTRIPGNDQIGASENILMQSEAMTSSTADRTICYWGFVGKPNAEAMAEWLSVKSTDGETGEISYSKREGSVVHLVRDRAKVSFGNMFDFYRSASSSYTINGETVTLEDNKIDYEIRSIDWVLSNGLSKGYLAPYNTNGAPSDHFAGYYDPEANPMLDDNRKTPFEFPAGTNGRYAAAEGDLMRVWEYVEGDPLGRVYDNPLFLFEDDNLGDNPPKIILKVTYRKNRNRPYVAGGDNEVVKFHTLMLLKEDGTSADILRNHVYILNVQGLPYEGLGHVSFIDAINSVDYVNNRTVTIDDTVNDVTDGDYQLTISGATSLIYSDPALRNTVQTIGFRFIAVAGGNGDISGYTTADFEAEWVNNVLPTFAAPDVTVSSFNATTGEGTITFTLGTIINEGLQSGQILLRDKNTNLSRRINIFSISKFDMLPTGQTALRLVRDGTRTETISNVSCPVYKMDFIVPGDYPVGLFPIHVRMASTTLTPIGFSLDNGEEDSAIGVVMESTENGSMLDGVTLSGFDYSTEPRPWNYREEGKPWDFWYSYSIMTKPEVVDGEGGSTIVTRDLLATFYFADTRALRAADNRNTSIGLYLFIKHFGPVTPVTQ